MTYFIAKFSNIEENINLYREYKRRLNDSIKDVYSLSGNVDACWNDMNSLDFVDILHNDRIKIYDYLEKIDTLYDDLYSFSSSLQTICNRFNSSSKSLKFNDEKLTMVYEKISQISQYVKNAEYYLNLCDFNSDFEQYYKVKQLTKAISTIRKDINTILNNIKKLSSGVNKTITDYRTVFSKNKGIEFNIEIPVYRSNMVGFYVSKYQDKVVDNVKVGSARNNSKSKEIGSMSVQSSVVNQSMIKGFSDEVDANLGVASVNYVKNKFDDVDNDKTVFSVSKESASVANLKDFDDDKKIDFNVELINSKENNMNCYDVDIENDVTVNKITSNDNNLDIENNLVNMNFESNVVTSDSKTVKVDNIAINNNADSVVSENDTHVNNFVNDVNINSPRNVNSANNNINIINNDINLKTESSVIINDSSTVRVLDANINANSISSVEVANNNFNVVGVENINSVSSVNTESVHVDINEFL